MIDILLDIVGFVVAISVLVAVHEYGHFWVARRLGFKVLRFSIGFGKPLLRWRSKDADQVEYWISALPLGGYVKMLDEREGEVDESEAHRAFNRRPIWARIAVLFAGPAANFLFAIAAFWLVYVTGVTGYRPYIEQVQPGSVAAEAGLRADDIIDAVGGQPIEMWDQLPVRMFNELLGDGVIELDVIEADGSRRQLEFDVRGRVGELTEPNALLDGLGIVPGPTTGIIRIVEVPEDSVAGRAGLRADDTVVAVDGQPMATLDDFIAYIRQRPEQSVDLSVERDGRPVELRVPVALVDQEGEQIGQIGISLRQQLPDGMLERLRAERRYGPLRSLGVAARETWEMTDLTLRFLGRMLIGEVSIKNMSGPLMIANYAGDYVQAGFNEYLTFLCLISISLGIMNLLPVPILDGGQIVMCVVEAFKGKPLSMRAAIIGQQVGLAMLIALMGVVFYNDIARILGL